jgi:hypothetical protein
MKPSIEWYVSKHRVYRILGCKSILKSSDLQSHPAVKMACCKKRLQSEKEIERALEESGSEFGDDIFSESKNSSESESEDNAEESAVEYSKSR